MRKYKKIQFKHVGLNLNSLLGKINNILSKEQSIIYEKYNVIVQGLTTDVSVSKLIDKNQNFVSKGVKSGDKITVLPNENFKNFNINTNPTEVYVNVVNNETTITVMNNKGEALSGILPFEASYKIERLEYTSEPTGNEKKSQNKNTFTGVESVGEYVELYVINVGFYEYCIEQGLNPNNTSSKNSFIKIFNGSKEGTYLSTNVINKMLSEIWIPVNTGISINDKFLEAVESLQQTLFKVQVILTITIVGLELIKFLISFYANAIKLAIIFVLDQIINFLDTIKKIGGYMYTSYITAPHYNKVSETIFGWANIGFDNKGNLIEFVKLKLENTIEEKNKAISLKITGPIMLLEYMINQENELKDIGILKTELQDDPIFKKSLTALNQINTKIIKLDEEIQQYQAILEYHKLFGIPIVYFEEQIEHFTKNLEQVEADILKEEEIRKQQNRNATTSAGQYKSNNILGNIPRFTASQTAGSITLFVTVSENLENFANGIKGMSALVSLMGKIGLVGPSGVSSLIKLVVDFDKWVKHIEKLPEILEVNTNLNFEPKASVDGWSAWNVGNIGGKTVNNFLDDSINFFQGIKDDYSIAHDKWLELTIDALTEDIKTINKIIEDITEVLNFFELLTAEEEFFKVRALVIPPQFGGQQKLINSLKKSNALFRPKDREIVLFQSTFVGGGFGFTLLYNLLFASNSLALPILEEKVLTEDAFFALKTLYEGTNSSDDERGKQYLKETFEYDDSISQATIEKTNEKISNLKKLYRGDLESLRPNENKDSKKPEHREILAESREILEEIKNS